MKKLSPLLFTAIALVITLLACRKIQPDFDVSAEDPCDCASEVSADFDIIEERANGLTPEQNTYTITDGIIANKRAYFRAKEEEANYTWYIGIDTLTNREVNRFFQEQWAGSNIPITLVVEKQPNSNCFPNDDGYDSITKFMPVYGFCDTNIMEGTFRIAEENSIDSFDIVLDIEEAYEGPGVLEANNCSRIDFYNYDRNGSNCIGYNNTILRNYREIEYDGFNQFGGDPLDCNRVAISRATLKLSGEYFIRYGIYNFSEVAYDYYELFGRKLN